MTALPAGHLLAAAAGRGALPLRALRESAFILPPRRAKSTLHDFILEQCRRAGGFTPRVAREEANLAHVINLVAAGEGVTIVPAHLREPGLPGVVYRPLARPVARMEVCLAWRAVEPAALVRDLVGSLSKPARSVGPK